jgi:hypothetical protein
MSLRNENIGIAVGVAVLMLGYLLTGWEPGRVEAALIGTSMIGAALGVSFHLNKRDRKRGREPDHLPFKR